jgi:hypothetical protein
MPISDVHHCSSLFIVCQQTESIVLPIEGRLYSSIEDIHHMSTSGIHHMPPMGTTICQPLAIHYMPIRKAPSYVGGTWDLPRATSFHGHPYVRASARLKHAFSFASFYNSYTYLIHCLAQSMDVPCYWSSWRLKLEGVFRNGYSVGIHIYIPHTHNLL